MRSTSPTRVCLPLNALALITSCLAACSSETENGAYATASSSSGPGGTGGAGGISSASSASGAGGNGGAGGGFVCAPGSTDACYSGPQGTQDVGVCKAGLRTCDAEGTAFGPCEGEVLPGAESCGTPEDESCNGASACTGTHLWSKRFGDSEYQASYHVATDAAGNVLVVSGVLGSADFGGGPLASAGSSDVTIVKLGPDGSHLWSRMFGGPAPDYGNGIAIDSASNVFVTGWYTGSVDFGGGPLPNGGLEDIFVLKLSPDGSHVWSKGFGGVGYQNAYHIAADASSNVVIGGPLKNTADFGGGALTSAGGSDVFVAKFDPDGEPIWSSRFGDAADQHANAVAFDGSGNMLVTGTFLGSIDFGGGALESAALSDIFVAKFDPKGKYLWSRRFGGSGYEGGVEIASSASGAIHLYGSFQSAVDFGGGALQSAGGSDLFLLALDAAGQHLWSKRFGGPGDENPGAMAIDGKGQIALGGNFSTTIDFGSGPLQSAGLFDMFVAKLDSSGNPHWTLRAGDAADQGATRVAMDTPGNVLLCGTILGSADFGGGPLTSAGEGDIVVAKLGP